MKKLDKKQICIITLLSLAGVLVASVSIFLIHNIFTATLPAIEELQAQGFGIKELLKSLYLNIFFQLVMLFTYALALWFGIGYCKKLGKKED